MIAVTSIKRGKEMVYDIRIIEEKCIGCGACADECDNFEIKDDGKAFAKNQKLRK